MYIFFCVNAPYERILERTYIILQILVNGDSSLQDIKDIYGKFKKKTVGEVREDQISLLLSRSPTIF